MIRIVSAVALITALGMSTAALAQPVVAGGPAAKGNAPLKPAHTINDGAAKPGASSFTEGEARTHIVHAGYASVSNLVKGKDGVWRGTATKNGATINVGLDFKGNVSEGGAVETQMSTTDTAKTAGMAAPVSATTTASSTKRTTVAEPASTTTPYHHRRRHRRTHKAHCVHPGVNGVACSGIDRNDNGISDKEDRAITAGARP